MATKDNIALQTSIQIDRHKAETKVKKDWNEKYCWMSDKYKQMQERLQAVSKKSQYMKEFFLEKKQDERNISPFPVSTNHEYGWICNKPEFSLRFLGHDLPQYPPLPRDVKLVKPWD